MATLLDLAAVGRRIVLVTLALEPPRQYLGNITVYHLPHLVDDLILPEEIKPEMTLAAETTSTKGGGAR